MSNLSNKIKSYCKKNYWALLGFLFNPIGTLIFLGSVVSFYETDINFKLTIWGYIVAVIIALIVLTKLNSKFKKLEHGVTRGLLLSILPMVIWCAGFGIVYALNSLAGNAVTYWVICGAFFIASRFCYIMHEIKNSDKEESEPTTPPTQTETGANNA